MRTCPVCESPCSNGAEGDYIQCTSCESYVYIGSQPAEQDNRSFYDSIDFHDRDYPRSRIKSKIFRAFDKKNKSRNASECRTYQEIRDEIHRALRKPGTVVEIGFGQGVILESLLREGVDAYGMDISHNLVGRFQQKFPKYRDRVMVGTQFNRPVDTVFCSALLEHIDEPARFIKQASVNLNPGGAMIIDNLPVLNSRESSITIEEDISFWKPCHRVIYSSRGLEGLLQRHGFRLEHCAMMDSFNYRVLSLHIRKGYSDIVRLRASCRANRRLPGTIEYYLLCKEALRIRSNALVGSFVFRKC